MAFIYAGNDLLSLIWKFAYRCVVQNVVHMIVTGDPNLVQDHSFTIVQEDQLAVFHELGFAEIRAQLILRVAVRPRADTHDAARYISRFEQVLTRRILRCSNVKGKRDLGAYHTVGLGQGRQARCEDN
jgi:hypothetical protein